MSDGNVNKQYRVLTAIGPDRAGLVEQVSGHIHQQGGNLEDSRMAILGGEFALIVLFSGAPEAIERVEANLDQLMQQTGLQVSLKATAPAPPRDFIPYRLRVTGFDRPGIVATISRVLSKRNINVASLDSRLQFAPLSGTPMFVLGAEIQVPSTTAVSALRQDLSHACDEENLDFVLESG